MARPSIYSEETADLIIRLLIEGAAVKEAARISGVSVRTINRWANEIPEFKEKFKFIINKRNADDTIVDAYAMRKQLAEQYLNDLLAGKAIKRTTTTTTNPDGSTIVCVKEEAQLPSKWVVERVLGAGPSPEQDLNINVRLAEPEDFEDLPGEV
jgi:hypothetical protein